MYRLSYERQSDISFIARETISLMIVNDNDCLKYAKHLEITKTNQK